MVWLKKSSRRKNMYEKEQEETVENMAVTEEVCGKTDPEEMMVVENNVEEVPAQKETSEEEKDGMIQEEDPETDESGLILECFAESQPEKKDMKAFFLTAVAAVAAAVLWCFCALLRRKKKR